MYQRVFIVKEGSWGSVEAESYQGQIEMYRRTLEEAKDSRGDKLADVKTIETAKEAEERAKMEADVVVFISRGMGEKAERLAKAFPRVKVIVFTGAIPEGKVIWVSKGWVDSRKEICDIVLRW